MLRRSHDSSIFIASAYGVLREWLFHGIDVIFQQSQFFLQSFLVLQCSLGEAYLSVYVRVWIKFRFSTTTTKTHVRSIENSWPRRDARSIEVFSEKYREEQVRVSQIREWVSPSVSNLMTHNRRHEIWIVPLGKAWWVELTTRQRRYRRTLLRFESGLVVLPVEVHLRDELKFVPVFVNSISVTL